MKLKNSNKFFARWRKSLQFYRRTGYDITEESNEILRQKEAKEQMSKCDEDHSEWLEIYPEEDWITSIWTTVQVRWSLIHYHPMG